MAVLDWDADVGILPDACEFGISYNTMISTSPLSGTTRTYELPGARWSTRLSFSNLDSSESREIISFLTRLRGANGRFYSYDFGNPTPRGTLSSGSVVVASVTSGTLREITLQQSGGASLSGTLLPGDYISIGNDTDRELKMITGALGSDTYSFEPILRKPNHDYTGEPISYIKASTVFMLSSDDQAYWSTRGRGLLTDIDIEAVEIFLPAGA